MSDATPTLPWSDGEPPPEPGHAIGRFQVVGSLGAGGMGVVLSAYDPDLDRMVAIKLLRGDSWSGEREASGREALLREARAMARFSHPNVVAVYEVSAAGGGAFVVMEQVEGRTLRAWLDETHPAPREVLEMFLQAGTGLAAAHRAGVVHRDFKPENVLIGNDGRPRVSDFGLAMGAPPGAGTRAYMAPEQAAGKQVDARADQYAFCVALWEALQGERPEAGKTAIGPRPPRVRRALERGLAERPEDRWPTMDALLAALRPRRAGSRVMVAVLGVSLLAAGAALVASRRSAPERPRRISDLNPRQLTFDGRAVSLGLSPDGRTLAYRSGSGVHLLDLAGNGERKIATDVPAEAEFFGIGKWLDDSSAIELTYLHGDQLGRPWEWRVPREGGPSLKVAPTFRGAYGGGGQELISTALFAAEFEVRRAGEPVRKLRLRANHDTQRVVDWAQDATWFLAVTESGNTKTVWTLSLDGQRQTRLLEWAQRQQQAVLEDVRLAPAGRGVLYLRRRTARESDLMFMPLRQGEPAGESRIVIEGIEADEISLSRDGKRLAYTRSREPAHVWLFSIDPPESASPDVRARRVLGDAAPKGSVCLAPDGGQIAYAGLEGRWHSLFVVGADGGLPRRLVSMDGDVMSPSWSADGRELAFALTSSGGKSSVWIVSAIDGRARQLSTPAVVGPVTWAPQAAIAVSTPDYLNFILIDPRTSAHRPLLRSEVSGWGWGVWGLKWSPDGAWAAILRVRDGVYGLWIVSADGRTERRIGGDDLPVGWSSDGQWIYAQAVVTKHIRRIPFSGGEPQPWLVLPCDEDVSQCSSSADGREIACLTGTIGIPWLGESDVWMIEDFDQLLPR